MMMATLTRLFVINMVAKRRSVSARSCSILVSAGWLCCFILSMSVGVREKNAISEAETKAEQPSNRIASTRANIVPGPGAVSCMLPDRLFRKDRKGSGSKMYYCWWNIGLKGEVFVLVFCGDFGGYGVLGALVFGAVGEYFKVVYVYFGDVALNSVLVVIGTGA